jgi:hypothetical protein
MNHNAPYDLRGGEYTNMARFELDQLFGLALTDSRFFRQLREHPRQAIVQFELSESETQAVLDIAPQISSIQELATRLDSWMTSHAGAVAQEQVLAPALALHCSPLLDLGSNPEGCPYTHTSNTIREKEQGICLTLSEYIAQN